MTTDSMSALIYYFICFNEFSIGRNILSTRTTLKLQNFLCMFLDTHSFKYNSNLFFFSSFDCFALYYPLLKCYTTHFLYRHISWGEKKIKNKKQNKTKQNKLNNNKKINNKKYTKQKKKVQF